MSSALRRRRGDMNDGVEEEQADALKEEEMAKECCGGFDFGKRIGLYPMLAKDVGRGKDDEKGFCGGRQGGLSTIGRTVERFLHVQRHLDVRWSMVFSTLRLMLTVLLVLNAALDDSGMGSAPKGHKVLQVYEMEQYDVVEGQTAGSLGVDGLEAGAEINLYKYRATGRSEHLPARCSSGSLDIMASAQLRAAYIWSGCQVGVGEAAIAQWTGGNVSDGYDGRNFYWHGFALQMFNIDGGDDDYYDHDDNYYVNDDFVVRDDDIYDDDDDPKRPPLFRCKDVAYPMSWKPVGDWPLNPDQRPPSISRSDLAPFSSFRKCLPEAGYITESPPETVWVVAATPLGGNPRVVRETVVFGLALFLTSLLPNLFLSARLLFFPGTCCDLCGCSCVTRDDCVTVLACPCCCRRCGDADSDTSPPGACDCGRDVPPHTMYCCRCCGKPGVPSPTSTSAVQTDLPDTPPQNRTTIQGASVATQWTSTFVGSEKWAISRFDRLYERPWMRCNISMLSFAIALMAALPISVVCEDIISASDLGLPSYDKGLCPATLDNCDCGPSMNDDNFNNDDHHSTNGFRCNSTALDSGLCGVVTVYDNARIVTNGTLSFLLLLVYVLGHVCPARMNPRLLPPCCVCCMRPEVIYDVELDDPPQTAPRPSDESDLALTPKGTVVVGPVLPSRSRSTCEMCNQGGPRFISAPRTWAAYMADTSAFLGTLVIAHVIAYSTVSTTVHSTDLLGKAAFGSIWAIITAVLSQIPGALALFK